MTSIPNLARRPSGLYAPSSKFETVVGSRSQEPAVTGGHVSNGTDTGQNTRLRHNVPGNAQYVRLLYVNAYSLNGANGIGGIVQILLTAAVESARAVFFNGQRQVALDPGGMVLSDPVAVAALGAAIFTRTAVSTAGGLAASGAWPLMQYCSPTQGEGTATTATGVAPTDLTLSGTITASNGFAFGPVAVISVPQDNKPALGGYGDSIAAGKNDNGPAGDYYLWGFLPRAVNQQFGFISLGQGGDVVGSVTSPTAYDHRLELIAACTSICCQYGTNDVNSVATQSAIQAGMVAAWQTLGGFGARVFQTTIVPRTTSTDAWATTTNQTPIATNSAETKRQAINTWLRAGAPVVAGVAVAVGTSGALLAGVPGHPLYESWDIAAQVESTAGGTPGAGGSVWQVAAATVDGIHPGPGGHAAMATACPMAHVI